MTLTCALVEDDAALARLAPEWEALMGRSDADEPTLSPLWLGAWWRAFGGLDRRRLQVVTFYHTGRLVGLAPLVGRLHWYRPGLPYRRLELVGSGEPEADEICSDYVGLIAERGAEEAVAGALATALEDGTLGAWDEFLLPGMNGDAALPPLVTGALISSGLRAECTPFGSCPYIPLPPTWDEYLKQLPSQRRYLVTRSLRDFEKWAGGPGELTVVDSLAALEEGKRVLMSLHGERWGQEGHSGVFLSSRFAAFHDAVMPQLLAKGALELAWLSVRGDPIAVLYNIVWNGKVHFYQSGRKVELPKQIRPGIVVHALAIQRAISAGRREYDFLNGTAQYKLQLALATRPLVTVRAVRSRVRERARLLTERLAQAASRRWKVARKS